MLERSRAVTRRMFSSPGTPKTTVIPSFSRHRTSSSAAASRPDWPSCSPALILSVSFCSRGLGTCGLGMVAGMANVSAQLSPELHGYMAAHSSSPNEVTRDLIAETRHLLPDRSQVQIPSEPAAFLTGPNPRP